MDPIKIELIRPGLEREAREPKTEPGEPQAESGEPKAEPGEPQAEPGESQAEPNEPDSNDNGLPEQTDAGPEPDLSTPDTAETTEAPHGEANPESLSNEKLSWYFIKNNKNEPTRGAGQIDIIAFGGRYIGDTEKNELYLTFDQGYENGYTEGILDTLRENGVSAAFFLTKTYIRDNPDIVRRMATEGHVCANHSATHASFPDLSGEGIAFEIGETARYFNETTGAHMDQFFRPPNGEYSERSMELTRRLGYMTVFWSYAYLDWDVANQPGKKAAYDNVMGNLHNGAVILLHSVSESNALALGEMIDSIKDRGFVFKSLYELP